MTEQPTTSNLVAGIYRRIYAGFLTGRRINSVSLQAEAWFWRLHALADDLGNVYGDPAVLRAYAAPRRAVTVQEAAGWVDELAGAGLVRRYQDNGDDYLHIDGFEDRQPAGKNGRRLQKFPIHPVNLGALCGIRVNPGEPGKSKPSHSHSHSHSKIDKASALSSAPAAPGGIDEDVPRETRKPRKRQRLEARDPGPPLGLGEVTPAHGTPPASETPQRPRKAREPNPLWDAVAAEFYPSGVPPSHSKQVGRVVADLRAMNATPAEVRARATRYRTAWPTHACTPHALVAYWDQFREGEKPAPKPAPRVTNDHAEALARLRAANPEALAAAVAQVEADYRTAIANVRRTYGLPDAPLIELAERSRMLALCIADAL